MIADTSSQTPTKRILLGERKKIIRLAYIQGKGRIGDLCRIHNVSIATCKDWKKKEGWTDLRIKWEQAELNRLSNPSFEYPNNLAKVSSELTEIEQNEAIRARIREQMLTSRDSDELRDLSMAYDRLFSAWCILTGTARPAPARVSAKPKITRSEVAPASIPAAEPQRAPTPAPGLFADNRPVEEPESQL